MESEYLTKAVFETWVDEDREFKKRILDHIDQQHTLNGQMGADIARVSSEHDMVKSKAAGWSTGISAVVSAIVTAIFSAMRGH